MRRPAHHRFHNKHGGGGLKGTLGRLSVGAVVLAICTVSLLFFSTLNSGGGGGGYVGRSEINVEELWETAESGGWRPSSAPRSYWPPPPKESSGYLRVRCNGGLNQQRTAICNAVLAARIMNATLVLPELDANSFWHDDSGFQGIYDVEHFIKTLRYDVRIVERIPEIRKNGKVKKLKAYQLRPPRDAPISWYTTEALEKMKEHGAIYLTPFSHRLAEEIDNAEYQRLRCRVNYHALRFKPHIMKLSESIVDKLRAEGHFMSIHLRFEMDMLAFAGCFDIFTPEEQRMLKKYREQNFAKKRLVYSERRGRLLLPLIQRTYTHIYIHTQNSKKSLITQDTHTQTRRLVSNLCVDMSSSGRKETLRGYQRRKNFDLNIPAIENVTLDQEGPSHQYEVQEVQVRQQGQPLPPATIDVEALDDDVVESSPRSFAEAKSKRNRGRVSADVVVLESDGLSRVAHTNPNKRRRGTQQQTIINCEYINLDSNSNSTNVVHMPPAPPKEITFNCPICLNALDEEMSTKCGHIFCKKCIKAAIAAQGKCPTCRKKVTERGLIRVFLPATNS